MRSHLSASFALTHGLAAVVVVGRGERRARRQLPSRAASRRATGGARGSTGKPCEA